MLTALESNDIFLQRSANFLVGDVACKGRRVLLKHPVNICLTCVVKHLWSTAGVVLVMFAFVVLVVGVFF